MLEFQALRAYAYVIANRIAKDERGEVTEKVIMTAIFAALAIAAGAIIVAKVTAKANSIPTD